MFFLWPVTQSGGNNGLQLEVLQTMEKLLTDEQLAHELGLKRRTIKTLRGDGKIPFVRIGEKTLRYRRTAVEAALAKMEVKAVTERRR